MCEIKTNEIGKFILVSKERYDIASQYKWHLKSSQNLIYPFCYIDSNKQSFGKIVFGLTRDKCIIHLNGNTLDFRDDQILIIDKNQAGHFVGKNKTKPVQYNNVKKYKDKYRVRFMVKGKAIYEGYIYKTPEEAAIVADYTSFKYFSESKYLNFPNMSQKEREEKYKAIAERYGKDKYERKSKGQQGLACKRVNKSSLYVGVHKNRNKFYARIKKDGIQIKIASFYNQEEAAIAYDITSVKLYGINAKVNFEENREKYVKILSESTEWNIEKMVIAVIKN